MEAGYVLVIGSSGIDMKGRPWGDVDWETSNLGRIRNSVGGAARNIAENLARLDTSTILITAVGKDAAGRRIIRQNERAGIECSYVRHIPTGRTGAYMALLYPDGQLHVGVSDFEIMRYLDSDYLLEHEYLVERATIVVIDATLSEDTLGTVFELAERYNVRVVADPTTPALAGRLCPYIPQLYMIVPNVSEIESLCGVLSPVEDRDLAAQAARELVTKGAKIAVVTLGAEGLAYAHSNGGGFMKPNNTRVVDTTGAGDAFTAAAIFGLLNDVPVDEAMRLGSAAASLTVESRYTVLPEISQELLYDKLVL